MKHEDEAEPARVELAFSCFGWPQLYMDGERTEHAPSAKAMALLIYLAYHPHEQPRTKMIDLLWSESSEKKAQSSLRSALYSIAQWLGDILVVTRKTIRYAPHIQCVRDTDPFFESTHQTHAWIPSIQEPFLASFRVKDAPLFDLWLQTMREQLHEQVMLQLRTSLKRAEVRHDVEQSIQLAQKVLQFERWNEEAYRSLMLAYARRGEHTKALLSFKECTDILAEEIGSKPSHTLRTLHNRISDALESVACSRPPQHTSCIGRTQELERLHQILTLPEHRLLILTGIGGVGKTHIAAQLYPWLERRFLHGVHWLDTRPIQHTTQLTSTLLHSLSLESTRPKEADIEFIQHCADWEWILILDNIEHLLNEHHALPLLEQWLAALPGLKIIVTSRIQLHHPEAILFPLDGLSLETTRAENTESPSHLSDAHQLLLKRIWRLAPAYDAGSEPQLLHDFCRALHGWPLGLELAAPLFLNAQTKQELSNALNDSMDSMHGAWLQTLDEEARLDALFSRSLAQLSEHERHIFDVAILFRGGADAGLFSELFGATQECLHKLCQHSLLHAQGTRYVMHPLLQEWGVQQLASKMQYPEWQHAFSDFFLRTLCTHYVDPFTRQESLHTFVHTEWSNLHTAWKLAIDFENWKSIEQAIEPLYKYFEESGRLYEGYTWYKRLLDTETQRPFSAQLHVSILASTARLLSLLDLTQESHQLIKQAHQHIEPTHAPSIRYFVWNTKGAIEIRQGDFSQSESSFAQAHMLAKEHLPAPWQVRPLVNLGSAYLRTGQLHKALKVLQEGRRLCEEHSLLHGLAHILNNLGMVFLLQEQFSSALEAFSQSLTLIKQLQYTYMQACLHENLSEVLFKLERYEESLLQAQESSQHWSALKNQNGLVRAMYSQLLPLFELDHVEQAFQTCVQALELAEQLESKSVKIGLLTYIAQCLSKHDESQLALALAAYILHQPETEQQHQQRLHKLIQSGPDRESPHSKHIYPTTIQAWILRLKTLYQARLHTL